MEDNVEIKTEEIGKVFAYSIKLKIERYKGENRIRIPALEEDLRDDNWKSFMLDLHDDDSLDILIKTGKPEYFIIREKCEVIAETLFKKKYSDAYIGNRIKKREYKQTKKTPKYELGALHLEGTVEIKV